MPSVRAFAKFLAAVLAASALASCVGVDAAVEVQANGSGRVALDYRVSRMVESMGKVEGDDRSLPLPLTRAGFDAVMARVPGMSLRSYSASEDEVDLRVKAELGFSDVAALASFLNAVGRKSASVSEGGRRSLSLTVSEGGGPLDPDLQNLVTAVFRGYSVKIRVIAPSDAAAVVQGLPGSASSSSGRSASFEASLSDLLSGRDRAVWTVSWKE